MRYENIIYIFRFFIYLAICYSQTPEYFIKTFFEIYKSEDIDKAVDALYGSSPDVYGTRDAMKLQLKKRLKTAGKYCGGADLVTTKTAGANVVMFTYVVRHVVEPLTFRMMFYKADNFWQLQSFKVTNDIANDLEEASKPCKSNQNVKDIFKYQ